MMNKHPAPGAGIARAKARLAAHREAQAERLKDAAPPVMTRQRRRQSERYDSHFETPTQRAYRAVKGQLPTHPKSTFVHWR